MPKEENIQKNLIINTLIVDVIIFALLSIFFFFDLKEIPLGFALGAVISIINHLILCLQANVMLNQSIGIGAAPITMVCYFTRFVLYGLGLFAAFYLNYLGYKIFAWYTVFVAYMIIKVIILTKYGKYRKNPNIVKPNSPEYFNKVVLDEPTIEQNKKEDN